MADAYVRGSASWRPMSTPARLHPGASRVLLYMGSKVEPVQFSKAFARVAVTPFSDFVRVRTVDRGFHDHARDLRLT
jgi:hypothetical protein